MTNSPKPWPLPVQNPVLLAPPRAFAVALKGNVNAAAVDEAMGAPTAVVIRSDDLSAVVDAEGLGIGG
jgi:hypothetical protein